MRWIAPIILLILTAFAPAQAAQPPARLVSDGSGSFIAVVEKSTPQIDAVAAIQAVLQECFRCSLTKEQVRDSLILHGWTAMEKEAVPVRGKYRFSREVIYGMHATITPADLSLLSERTSAKYGNRIEAPLLQRAAETFAAHPSIEVGPVVNFLKDNNYPWALVAPPAPDGLKRDIRSPLWGIMAAVAGIATLGLTFLLRKRSRRTLAHTPRPAGQEIRKERFSWMGEWRGVLRDAMRTSRPTGRIIKGKISSWLALPAMWSRSLSLRPHHVEDTAWGCIQDILADAAYVAIRLNKVKQAGWRTVHAFVGLIDGADKQRVGRELELLYDALAARGYLGFSWGTRLEYAGEGRHWRERYLSYLRGLWGLKIVLIEGAEPAPAPRIKRRQFLAFSFKRP